ncbi:M24 family metallopeptidase [Amycolatopsis pithecellobii]|uniref:M24 family metallopeptidase n=1 Tax=Amycolatopsis pithecellobii TaxID=664692 RepID=A0A6N7YQ73_9PSEU|nr:Xaa-Pro peptidase family protein [Amycolatopsis pithecellobii]MTD54038.1 M24 family metallopeptidase [Amycolatopsis pithecellobii]
MIESVQAAVDPTQTSEALVQRVAAYGLRRTQAAMKEHDLPAALLFDADNIRYLTGTAVMRAWTLHGMDRFLLVPADGSPVLWEYPSVRTAEDPRRLHELRSAPSWSVFDVGTRSARRAAEFVGELIATLRSLGIEDDRIGIDRTDAYGFLALQAAGLSVQPAQFSLESARSIKSAEEIELIRRSLAVCDAAVAHLYENLRPGMTELEAWSLFSAHAFINGAEYVECRLLSSGPRTNPWFQEATARRIGPGDVVSFDTDLVGPSGYLADVSRAYLTGDVRSTERQRRLYGDAEEFLQNILDELRPGADTADLGRSLCKKFPAKYHAQRYPFIAHSAGLSDEFPTIVFDNHDTGVTVQPGMVFCIEAYVGEVGDAEGMKLEEQVLITDAGPEVLSKAPHDTRLAQRS